MQFDPLCLAYAPVLSLFVEWLKGGAWADHFKIGRLPGPVVIASVVAFAVEMVRHVLGASVHPHLVAQSMTVALCLLLAVGGAVATHEVIVEPLQNKA